jgi:hypothetical protein
MPSVDAERLDVLGAGQARPTLEDWLATLVYLITGTSFRRMVRNEMSFV